MGIIVNNMDMPECCDVCLFSDWSNLHQTASCKLKGYEPAFDRFSTEYRHRRSDRCPLEELPKGHWTIKNIYTYDLAYGTTAYEPVYKCSKCGRIMESYLRLDEPTMPEDADFPRYCPHCGALMENGQE